MSARHDAASSRESVKSGPDNCIEIGQRGGGQSTSAAKCARLNGA